MRRVLVVALLIGGIGLLMMVGVLGLARHNDVANIGWIYYFADEGLGVVRPDGNGRRLVSRGVNERDAYLTVSGEGRWLIFGQESGNIYRVDRVFGRVEMLTDLPATENQRERSHSKEWLTIFHDFTLYRLRYDGSDFAPILTDVRNFAPFGWTENGKLLLFRGYYEDVWGLYLLDLETGQLTKLSGDLVGLVREARFSADEQSVLYWQDVGANVYHLFRVQLDGSNRLQLSDDSVQYFETDFSPDGAWLLYRSCNEAECDLYRVQVDGTSRQQLTFLEGVERRLRWIDNGNGLVFLSDQQCRIELYRLDIENGEMMQLAHNMSFSCEYSDFVALAPDEGSMIYRQTDLNMLTSSLWLIPLDGGEAVELVGSNRNANFQAWLPDSDSLLVVGHENGLASPQYLYRVDLQSGDVRQLSNRGVYPRFYTWSPVIELELNAQLLAVIGLAAIGGSLCVGYWLSRS